MTNHDVASVGSSKMWRRVAPAVGLFFLAPLVGEYLLGNVPARQIAAIPFLAPMYGGGALLVREAARRAGRGWPTMLLLAAAYGVLEAGLIDQSMFNPSFQGHDFQSSTPIPALGISATNTLSFVAGHVIWSIGVPIAIVEALVPHRSPAPWLGKVGLSVAGVFYVLGSSIIFRDLQEKEGFLASAPQLVGAGAVAASLIAVSFAVGRRPGTWADRRAPSPWLVGAASFVASSMFFARSDTWLVGVVLGTALLAVAVTVVTRYSRSAGWGAAHQLALAGGALATYAWGGYVLLSMTGSADAVNLVGQSVLVLGVVALLAAAARTVRKAGGSR